MSVDERWSRAEALFNEVLDQPPEERARFLELACAHDPDLRQEVESLLAAHAEDPDFMDTPLVRVRDVVDVRPGEEASYVGPYRVVRRLGQGGMGEVLLAVQEGEGFKRSVAVKLIRRGMDTEEVLRRFRLERRILAGLRHPHIAQLIDGGATDEGRPFFVMEYVEGLPIDDYCDGRRHPVDDRIALFREVCAAVQHAHGNLVVHRDLKPSNILVTPHGPPKLLDFGIGKLVDPEGAASDVSMTRTGVRPLTPGYASPEQIGGELVGVPSDVYQLGVLLYELLTGRHPYEEHLDAPARLEEALLSEEPPRPSTVARRVNTGYDVGSSTAPPEELARARASEPRKLSRRLAGDLDNIVHMAMRKEPHRRYPSVSALSEDLERHVQGLPVRARPDTLAYRAGKFVRRNRIPLAAVTAVFLVLMGATVYSVSQSRRVAKERDKALEVQGFLLEMFGASSPSQATGDSVTVRQLLDRQAEALETTYLDQPELRAQMMAVLAEGYDRLGLVNEAEPLARSALEIRREELGPDHADVAASLTLLGWILHQTGRSEEGEELLREAVPVWRDTRPLDVPGLSRALNDLGVMREADGDYDQAEGLYEEALEHRRRHFGDSHRSVAVTASNLSVILYRKADFAGAVEVGKEALEIMRRAVGPDHQRSLIIQGNVAAMRQVQGDWAGAEAEYRDLLERQTRLQGREHPATVRLMSALAMALLNRNASPSTAEAEVLLREALGIEERRSGRNSPQVALLLTRLGQSLSQQGRPLDAVPVLEEALAINRAIYGDEHLTVARSLEQLGQAHGGSGDPRAAERFQRQALEMLDRVIGADQLESNTTRLRYAHRLLMMRRYEEALSHYEETAERLAPTVSETHRNLHEIRLKVVSGHLGLGHAAVADSLLDHAVEYLERGGATPAQHALADSLRSRVDSATAGR